MTPPDRRAKNDRFANAYLAASALIMVALIIVVVILVLRQNRISADEHNSAILACQEANTSRTDDTAIWVRVLKLPPGASAAQKADVAVDLGLVRKTFKLHDCEALYSVKG